MTSAHVGSITPEVEVTVRPATHTFIDNSFQKLMNKCYPNRGYSPTTKVNLLDAFEALERIAQYHQDTLLCRAHYDIGLGSAWRPTPHAEKIARYRDYAVADITEHLGLPDSMYFGQATLLEIVHYCLQPLTE
jgi:hypothetical protein